MGWCVKWRKQQDKDQDEELNSLNWDKAGFEECWEDQNIEEIVKQHSTEEPSIQKIRNPETRTWNQIQAQEPRWTSQATGPTGRLTGP